MHAVHRIAKLRILSGILFQELAEDQGPAIQRRAAEHFGEGWRRCVWRHAQAGCVARSIGSNGADHGAEAVAGVAERHRAVAEGLADGPGNVHPDAAAIAPNLPFITDRGEIRGRSGRHREGDAFILVDVLALRLGAEGDRSEDIQRRHLTELAQGNGHERISAALKAGRDADVIAAAAFLVETLDVVGLTDRQRDRPGDDGRPITAAAQFLGDQHLAGGRRAVGIQPELRSVVAVQKEFIVAGHRWQEDAADAAAEVVPEVVRAQLGPGVEGIQKAHAVRAVREGGMHGKVGRLHAATGVVGLKLEPRAGLDAGGGRNLRVNDLVASHIGRRINDDGVERARRLSKHQLDRPRVRISNDRGRVEGRVHAIIDQVAELVACGIRVHRLAVFQNESVEQRRAGDRNYGRRRSVRIDREQGRAAGRRA